MYCMALQVHLADSSIDIIHAVRLLPRFGPIDTESSELFFSFLFYLLLLFNQISYTFLGCLAPLACSW